MCDKAAQGALDVQGSRWCSAAHTLLKGFLNSVSAQAAYKSVSAWLDRVAALLRQRTISPNTARILISDCPQPALHLLTVQVVDRSLQVLLRLKLHDADDAAAIMEHVRVAGLPALPEVVLREAHVSGHICQLAPGA